jgi:hypothetical protein
MIITGGCGVKNGDTEAVVEQTSPPANAPITPDTLDEKYKENPELLMADVYASHYGIAEQEALQRFEIADAFSGMETVLEREEPETFAGLWIQHEPTFCIVIAFTRRGEEAVKKYVAANLTAYVEVRTVKYSMADLWQARNQVEAFLRQESIPFESAIYVFDNIVEINVIDRTEIDAANQDGRLIIPECVRINIVEGFAVPE